MPTAKLRLSIPEHGWTHDVTTAYPDAQFRVIAILSGETNGIALLEIRATNPVSILADIERRDDIADFDLLWKQGDTTMVQIETTNPLLLSAILQTGIPVQTPFEVTDGTAVWKISTSSDRLSALGTRLDEVGIDFDIEYVYDEPSDPSNFLLTDRQREVLVAAAEQGYYETPRRATLTEVSDSLDISKATGSTVLHRAEGNVISWFIEEHVSGGGMPVR